MLLSANKLFLLVSQNTMVPDPYSYDCNMYCSSICTLPTGPPTTTSTTATPPTTAMIPLCPNNITKVVDHPDALVKVEWQLPAKIGFTKMISYQKVGVHVSKFPLAGASEICTFVITVKRK